MFSMVKICMFLCFLIFITKVCSLKCYNCAKSSLAECEKNQTVGDCPSSSFCSTLGFNLTYGVNKSMQLYTKTCAGPSSNCSSVFKETAVLKVKSCMYLKRCNTDYCNGVPPTTASPMTSGMPKSTDGSSHASKMTTKGAINDGSRLGNTLSVGVAGLLTFALMTIVFA